MSLYRSLDTAVQYIKGVGPQLAKRLASLGLFTLKDLLYDFPRGYEDWRHMTPISELKEGVNLCFMGTLDEIRVRPQNRLIKARLNDESGSVDCVWFNQLFLKNVLVSGVQLCVKGKVSFNAFTQAIQVNIEHHELVKPHGGCPKKVWPIYALTQGLTQKKRRLMSQEALTAAAYNLKDPLPVSTKETYGIGPLYDALKEMHEPSNKKQFEEARKRIVFDEFFYMQLPYLIRQKKQQVFSSVILHADGSSVTHYLKTLPYSLTEAQKQAIQAIQIDTKKGLAMNRLLQGDVGAGKTEVAIAALLMALDSGYQGAFLAPTEILAQQHYLKLKNRLTHVQIYLLKGKLKAKDKVQVKEALKQTQPFIVVGTHALLHDIELLPCLGMVIVDEQHRFGVMQRQALLEKPDRPHALFMSATPIPRSLALACYGELDKTIMREKPAGRKEPQTYFLKTNKGGKVYGFCHDKLRSGQQVYVVYPLVEASEKVSLTSAIEGWTYLARDIFPNYEVGLVHGQLAVSEKQAVMNDFRDNKIQVLVSTTVIEVGVDVPNASVMVIMHAERFGLSQLHQLRGRVGRGSEESACFLMADPKTLGAKKRIQAMLDTHDGFVLAEHDLMIRGCGDLLGLRQSGPVKLIVADLVKDEAVLKQAKEAVRSLLVKDPDLANHPQIKEKMIESQKLVNYIGLH